MDRSSPTDDSPIFGAISQGSKEEISVSKPTFFAGFPSPAEDFAEKGIDLNEILISHKEATFFLRVQGDAMAAWGIRDRDLLVVDRSLPVKSGSIVVAVIDGKLTVRQIEQRNRSCILRASDGYSKRDQSVTSEQTLIIWGVVCWSIHSV